MNKPLALTHITLFLAFAVTVCLSWGCKKTGNDGTTPHSTAVVPTLTTTDASLITQTSVQSGGTITADGGASVTARGICWSAAQNPTITTSPYTNDGIGTGTFASAIKSLTTSTTRYYIRAYATNSAGTGYGNQITISTVVASTVAIVLTSSYSNSAVIDFKTTNNGGAPITATGVCWSTSQNPTITNSKTTDGTDVGEFIASIDGLTVNTTYYVRAYATNSIGTSYSDQASFTTAYQIGQHFGGGLIFYIDATKVHGLIVTKEDQSGSAQWDNTSGGTWLAPGAYSTTDGAGNTTKIINTLGSGYNAAAICRACNDGGFTDWFLPAVSQLTLIQQNANALYPDSSVPGAFGGNEYWSSTESSNDVTAAFYMSLFGGPVYNDFKNNTHTVRAIRAF